MIARPNPQGRRLVRWLRYSMLTLLILLTVWILVIQAGFLAMRTPDARWPQKLLQLGQTLPPTFLNVPLPSGQRMHAVGIFAADSLPLVVLVHGSPGSADAYLPYLGDSALSRQMRLVAPDRPGFGYTDFGRAEGSLEAQAAALQALVALLAPGERVVLAGHSLGAPIIAQFALDYPEQVAGLILIAGSVDPALEPQPWWQPVVDAPPVRWLVPISFFTSNREIIPLRPQLEELLPRWSEIRCPVTVLHARNDRLVPVGNADFARRMLTASRDLQVNILPDGDHFILWNRAALVKQAIKEMVEKTR